ncbi:MAG: hypothetical protein ACO39R_06215 [Pontimonas sp.]
MKTLTKSAAIAEGLAEMVEEAVVVPAVPELTYDDYFPTPFCHVCLRPTCHVAEHDELVYAGLVEYNPRGTVGVVAWREGVTAEMVEAWDFYNGLTPNEQQFWWDWYK